MAPINFNVGIRVRYYNKDGCGNNSFNGMIGVITKLDRYDTNDCSVQFDNGKFREYCNYANLEVIECKEDKTMDIKSAYKIMSKNSGIAVGDRVKVLRIAEDDELGWNDIWSDDMDDMVGNTYTVDSINDNAEYRLDGWYFPFYVLEVVSKKSDLVTVLVDGKSHCISKSKADKIKAIVGGC